METDALLEALQAIEKATNEFFDDNDDDSYDATDCLGLVATIANQAIASA